MRSCAPARRGGPGLRLRTPFGIELDELVLAGWQRRHGAAAVQNGIGEAERVELGGAHGVVIAGDHVIDFVGRAVGVDDADHGNAENAGLVHGDVLVTDVDHEDRVRQGRQCLDAPEAALELGLLALAA